MPLAIALGYVASQLLSHGAVILQGQRDWHRIAHAATLGACVTFVSGPRLQRWRWVVWPAALALVAWLLVPIRAPQPGWLAWLAFLTTFLVVMAGVVEWSAIHVAGLLVLGGCALGATLLTAWLALETSVTLALGATSAAGAIVGGIIGLASSARPWRPVPELGLLMSILVGGWACVGCLSPLSPAPVALVVPFAAVSLLPIVALVTRFRARGRPEAA